MKTKQPDPFHGDPPKTIFELEMQARGVEIAARLVEFYRKMPGRAGTARGAVQYLKTEAQRLRWRTEHYKIPAPAEPIRDLAHLGGELESIGGRLEEAIPSSMSGPNTILRGDTIEGQSAQFLRAKWRTVFSTLRELYHLRRFAQLLQSGSPLGSQMGRLLERHRELLHGTRKALLLLQQRNFVDATKTLEQAVCQEDWHEKTEPFMSAYQPPVEPTGLRKST